MTQEVQSLPKGASFDQQIRVVEQRLLRRQASSRLHVARFRSQLRERMTSPLALLLAAGIGFALGPSKGSKSSEASSGIADINLLPTAMSMVSLAGSVMTLWQRFGASQPPRKDTSA